MLLPLNSGLVGLDLISPPILASWFLLPIRCILVWPDWMAVALMFVILRDF